MIQAADIAARLLEDGDFDPKEEINRMFPDRWIVVYQRPYERFVYYFTEKPDHGSAMWTQIEDDAFVFDAWSEAEKAIDYIAKQSNTFMGYVKIVHRPNLAESDEDFDPKAYAMSLPSPRWVITKKRSDGVTVYFVEMQNGWPVWHSGILWAKRFRTKEGAENTRNDFLREYDRWVQLDYPVIQVPGRQDEFGDEYD